MKLDFGNVAAMTVYLVGDPAKGGRMDFEGFMAALHAVLRHQGTAEPAGALDRAGGGARGAGHACRIRKCS
jgi:hypothetical protein